MARQSVLARPLLLSHDELNQRAKDIISSLRERNNLDKLGDRTRSSIGSISEPLSPRSLNTLYFASNELWASYLVGGNKAYLSLMMEIGQVLWSAFALDDAEKKFRPGAVRTFLRPQLPERILTHAIEDIYEDAKEIFSDAKARKDDNEFRGAILATFSIEIGSPNLDRESATQIVADSMDALSRIHNDFVKNYRDTGRTSTHDETDFIEECWRKIVSLAPVEKINPLLQTVATLAPKSMISDPEFISIIKRGSSDELYKFIQSRLDETQKELQKRLDVSFKLERIEKPKGKIFDQRAPKRNVLDERFIAAERALKDADTRKQSGESGHTEFANAISLLGTLAERLDGSQKDIALDYLGYALAKSGNLLLARLKLDDISEGYVYSTKYWNYVCCLPEDQNRFRLDLLKKGLSVAPSMKLLRAAIYVSIHEQDHDSLQELLPKLTFIQSLLLHFYGAYESSDGRQRDQLILRLGQYVLEDEIALGEASNQMKNSDAFPYERDIERLVARKHTEPVEFWFACLNMSSFKASPTVWGLRANFLEKIGQRAEGAKAFREELNRTLIGIERMLKFDKPYLNWVKTWKTQRIDRWLETCATAELRGIGASILDAITHFNTINADALKKCGVEINIRNPRLIRYYEEDRRVSLNVDTSAPLQVVRSSQSLEVAIIGLSSELERSFHEVSHIGLIRNKVRDAVNALLENSRKELSETLKELMATLESYAQQVTKDDKEQVWQSARANLRTFQTKARESISNEQFALIGPAIRAFDRVVNRLPRDAKLLPTVKVLPLNGREVVVDLTSTELSVPIKITNAGTSGPVRLRSARGRLKIIGGLELNLKLANDIVKFPVVVGSKESYVLNLETSENSLDSQETAILQVSVELDFGGSFFESSEENIKIVHSPFSETSCPRPYIFGRMIEANEVETHFFGRDAEQEEIVQSVAGGQQRFRYIEGLRRTGKSSLLNSIIAKIAKESLPLVPIYHSIAYCTGLENAGSMLFNILQDICSNKQLKSLQLQSPKEEQCRENPRAVFVDFSEQLRSQLGGRSVLLMIDDMQALGEWGASVKDVNASVFNSILGILNLVRESGRPNSPISWVFAGHVVRSEFRRMVPGALLWNDLRSLPIDFLPSTAISQIVLGPIQGTSFSIAPEAVTRLYQHSAGHPETVQHMADEMLQTAFRSRRSIMTPLDVDNATSVVATGYDDLFAETWFPYQQLSSVQIGLVSNLIHATVSAPGEPIGLQKIIPGSEFTESLQTAVNDLKNRKILVQFEDGSVSFKALVLDLWIRKWIDRFAGRKQQGNYVVLVDTANLTGGRPEALVPLTLNEDGTEISDEGTKYFALVTVLDAINDFIRSVTLAPYAALWAINYPKSSPAVMTLNDYGYLIENIPDELWAKGKGSDDIALISKMQVIENDFPTASIYFLILGDKDYRLQIDRLLRKGKQVYVLARQNSIAHTFERWSKLHPEIKVVSLEHIVKIFKSKTKS